MRVRRPLAVVLVAALAVAGPGAGGDGAGPPGVVASAGAAPRLDERNRGRLDDLVRFLQDTQNDDGGYGGQPGARSDPGFSAWVGIGLAAAGINPQDQRVPGARRSLVDYVARKGPVNTGSDGRWVTTEFERIGMLANAAGLDPRRFGGRDYVTPLLARQRQTAFVDQAPNGTPIRIPPGWFPHTESGRSPGVNDTIFAVFFLSGTGDRRLAPALERAGDAIEAMQRPDRTWPATRAGGPTDNDMTGAAIQALCALRRCGGPAVRGALDWLRARQRPDGGWGFSTGAAEGNSASTAWVVQALWSAGVDPRRWRVGRHDPLDFLAGLQRRDGSIRWMLSQDMNPTWMTAYAAPAFAGHAWPVPAPPLAATVRRQRQQRQRQAARRRQVHDERRRGRGGEARDDGGSVRAGGGGSGADLFSRPQPQSQGSTTGGVRDTRRRQARRRGTRGRDGATGTAAASGRGDDGGVQNQRRRERARGDGGAGAAVDGLVVDDQARGTEGREREQAVAPGLRTAREGGDATPWVTIGLLALLLGSAAVGSGREWRTVRTVAR